MIKYIIQFCVVFESFRIYGNVVFIEKERIFLLVGFRGIHAHRGNGFGIGFPIRTGHVYPGDIL